MRLSRRTLCTSLVAAGLSVLAAGPAASIAQAQDSAIGALKFRIASLYPKDLPPGIALDFFAKRVSELSGGKMTAQVFHGGTLYAENSAIQAVLDGTLDMGLASASNHGPFTKAWNVVELPYVVDSRQQFRDLFINGKIGETLKKETEKDGLRPLMIFETGGFRILHSTRLIKTPADLANMKTRVPQSAVPLTFWRTAGANATVISWTETYLALASKTIDGFDSSFPGSHMAKMGEVAKFITDVKYASVASLVGVSTDWWNKRSPVQKEILLKAAKEAEAVSMREELISEEKIKNELRKYGVTIYEPTAAEMQEWRKVGHSMWKDVPNVSKEILDAIQASAKATK